MVQAFRIEYRVTWAGTGAADVVHLSKCFLFFERCEKARASYVKQVLKLRFFLLLVSVL